jgi:hypothetical protein
VSAILNILVQFGFALVIFFFMISAAMALPGAVRLGLNPVTGSTGSHGKMQSYRGSRVDPG